MMFCMCACLCQLNEWLENSEPMIMIKQRVPTRWLSAHAMLDSLMVNKDTIRAICASDDEECKALQGKDLSDAEWKVLEVSSLFFFFLTFQLFILLHDHAQAALPLFTALADITKFMEGESYVLSYSVWIALARIENLLSPKVGDCAEVAALREAMNRDHMMKRVTLSESLRSSLHVLMHLLDHRLVPRCHFTNAMKFQSLLMSFIADGDTIVELF